MRTYLGIEIGGTKLQVVLGDAQAKILERFRFAVDPAQGALGIQRQLEQAVDQVALNNVEAIGVGFGGPVDGATGKVLTSYQIEGWGDFVLREWLENKTGRPTRVENDANVAALGEAIHGAGKNSRQVFYVTLGSGVGAGLVIDSKIHHGSRNSEAEFGHLRLDKSGRTVESSCSGWAVNDKVRRFALKHPETALAQAAKEHPRAESIALSRLLEGDDAAVSILDETTDDLAFALSHVVHLINPHTIILGGGLSLIGQPLLRSVEKKISHYLMDVLQPGPRVQLSALKEDVVPIGALTLAINQS